MVEAVVRVRMLRGLLIVAAVLVAIGVYLVVTGGDQQRARGMLLGGLAYAVLYLVIQRRSRGR